MKMFATSIIAGIAMLSGIACSGNKTEEIKSGVVSSTSTTTFTTVTTRNSFNEAMLPVCTKTKADLASVWDTINENRDKARLDGPIVSQSSLIRRALVATMKDAIEATQSWLASCRGSFPDEAAVYDSKLSEMKSELDELDH